MIIMYVGLNLQCVFRGTRHRLGLYACIPTSINNHYTDLKNNTQCSSTFKGKIKNFLLNKGYNSAKNGILMVSILLDFTRKILPTILRKLMVPKFTENPLQRIQYCISKS